MKKFVNANTNGFQKNSQNINRKGKPKLVLTSLTEYITSTYGAKPPKDEVIKLMEYIECLPINKLKAFIQDVKIPAIIQAYGRLILTGEQKDFRRVQGAEMLNDRLHGKPKQTTENFNETVLKQETILTPEEKKKIIDKL
jgi:hypothetical protein